MYIVAEHTEKSLLCFYPFDTEVEAEILCTTLDFIVTNILAFYYVSVVEDVDMMMQADSVTQFLEFVNDCLIDERTRWSRSGTSRCKKNKRGDSSR